MAKASAWWRRHHIRDLTQIAPPHISVVTNVGTARVGEFGGQDNIARAKGEIVGALPGDGLAVLNADDPPRAGNGRAHDR
ncbi:Mur ligase family protein [Streptomyces sparsogenes]|uniref:Mur ligase family protein n=1 Tax=Streptomyces sparsogenes TaxID=67365 RepID=UPI003F4CE2CA